MKSIIAAFLIVAFSIPVFAQDAVPLLQGEKAPSDGVLVSEVRFKKFLNAEIAADKLEAQLRVQERFTDSLESLYVKRLKTVSSQRWYETPGFNRWVGFGAGVLFTSLVVYVAM